MCVAVGDLCVALKRYRASVRCFRWAAKSEPDSEIVQQRLGWALWNADAVTDAELTFAWLLDVSPSATGASLDFAMLLQEQNRHAEALAVLDRGLSFEPHDPRLHNLRGVSLVALSQLDDAIGSFRYAVALEGTFADAVINLGAALADAGRWEEAVKWLTNAITLRRDAPSAFNLGLALIHLNRYAEAETAFRTALAFQPRPPELAAQASAHLALVILRQGREEEALEHADSLFRSHPDYLIVRNTLSSLLVAKGENARALTLARDSVHLYPSDFRAYLSLGWGLLTSTEASEALVAFDRAATLAIDDVSDVQAGRGAALSALGRHREALNVFEQLLARDPHYLERDLAGEYYRQSQAQLRGGE